MNSSPNDSASRSEEQPNGQNADPSTAPWACPECGVRNSGAGTECAGCGEMMPAGANMITEEVPQIPAEESAGRSTSMVYFATGAVMLVIAAVAFFLSADFSEPPAAPQNARLPAGHPQVPGATAAPAELQGRIDTARMALQADPENPQLQLQLANLLYDVNQHNEAVTYYSKYLTARPDDPDARTDMATSIASLGDLNLATSHLLEVIRSAPEHQKAMFNLAVVYYHRQMRDSVTHYLERVVAIDSTSQQGQVARQILTGDGMPPHRSPGQTAPQTAPGGTPPGVPGGAGGR